MAAEKRKVDGNQFFHLLTASAKTWELAAEVVETALREALVDAGFG